MLKGVHNILSDISIEVEGIVMIGKAIEMNGIIDKEHHLVLDKSLPVEGPKRVRVIIFLPEDEEIDEAQWLRAASSNQAFGFLKDPQEDIYTLSDGKPFNE